MNDNTLRIATRKSPLALWQAEFVKSQLEQKFPELTVELLPMSTKGDKILDAPLAKVGGKGLFVKELEVALLEKQADIAVHSMKDVPADFPEGLELRVICERDDPRDAFVSTKYRTLEDLPENSRLGTSSLRRQCQIRALCPDLQITDLRGNVGTRLRKLDDNLYDGIILAAAGLNRLKLAHRISSFLEPEQCLPAAGQGAVGIECRQGDERVYQLLDSLNHEVTGICVTAERAMNHHLQGGCQVPIGAFGELAGDKLTLQGLVGTPAGDKILQSQVVGDKKDAEKLGIELADELLAKGAKSILESINL